jgi:RNA polymerase sigma factor (sigma-70 family)
MANDSLTAFMNEAARYELLSTDQEIELSRRIQRWIALRDKDKDKLTTKERQAIRSGLRARERMIKCNLKLVIHVSKKYTHKLKHTAMQHEDIIQEGIFGLNRATELFDGTKGYKFSTYAYWWIRQAITRSLQTYGKVVRIPTNALQKLGKARKIQAEYLQQHKEPASLEYIAKQVEVSVEFLRMVIERSSIHMSLDAQLVEDGDALVDMMRSDESIFDQVEQDHEYQRLQQALAHLDEQEYDIIRNLYGLDGETEKTIRQYAGEKTACRERTRQKRNRALVKLGVAMNRSSSSAGTHQLSLIR